MRALLAGAALLVLATAGASAQPLEERRPPPAGPGLDRPSPLQDSPQAAPDDDDDDDMGAPLRRGGPPSPGDDDADAPPPPKSDRL